MLNPKQLKAIELLLCGNISLAGIAEEVGVSVSTVSKWKNSEEFANEYSARLKEVMNDAAVKAFKTVTDIMSNSDSDSSRLSAAKDLLDRAGYKAKDNDRSQLDKQLNITVNYGEGSLR